MTEYFNTVYRLILMFLPFRKAQHSKTAMTAEETLPTESEAIWKAEALQTLGVVSSHCLHEVH